MNTCTDKSCGVRALWRSLAAATLTAIFLCAGGHAAEPYGKIGEKYAALGRNTGPLGPAIGDEINAAHGGRLHLFKEGTIYWHPQIGQAFAVWGAISNKHRELGGVEYGYPITDESVTPDRRGRFNHFRALHRPDKPEASIYWTPQTGAHAVYGLIREHWARQGWERGPLGYPTSDEFQDGPYRRSNFERGYILWSAAKGAQSIKAGAAILERTPPGTFSTILVNGIEVAVKGERIAGNSRFLSEEAACALWSRELNRVNTSLKDFIRATANPRMGDFSIHSNAQMHMTPHCSFRAEVLTACADSMKIRMLLPRNLFLFQITTPTLFGSWADPKFSIDFDVEATADVRLPKTATSQMGLGPVTLRVSNIKFDSQNATGDVARALNTVRTLVTGNDLTARLRQDQVFRFEGVSRSLDQLSSEARRVPPNFHIDACMAEADSLKLNATD